jgi:LmbE family N-acetylglucosaminyl deacetylase
MTDPPVVVGVAPHPDDEILGAGATLMALRDAGWHVVNLACSLGRAADRERRREELIEACRTARFELVIADRAPPIEAADDLALAQAELQRTIADAVTQTGARLLVGPSPHDGHHGHEVVGRAICDAVESHGHPCQVMFWALWGGLPLPNLFVPFDASRLAELQRALAAHAGELARNPFDRLLEARAAANAVLGPELVFGFGAEGGLDRYAELFTSVNWSPDSGWRLAAPQRLDPARASASDIGPEIGWWLRAPSARAQLSAVRTPVPRRRDTPRPS